MQSPLSSGPAWLVYQHQLALAELMRDAESAGPDDHKPERQPRAGWVRRLSGRAFVKFGRWLEGPREPLDRPSYF